MHRFKNLSSIWLPVLWPALYDKSLGRTVRPLGRIGKCTTDRIQGFPQYIMISCTSYISHPLSSVPNTCSHLNSPSATPVCIFTILKSSSWASLLVLGDGVGEHYLLLLVSSIIHSSVQYFELAHGQGEEITPICYSLTLASRWPRFRCSPRLTPWEGRFVAFTIGCANIEKGEDQKCSAAGRS